MNSKVVIYTVGAITLAMLFVAITHSDDRYNKFMKECQLKRDYVWCELAWNSSVSGQRPLIAN